MARSVDMGYYYFNAGKKKNNSGDMDKLIDAVNGNFATFKEWEEMKITHQADGSLLERYKSNYSTFMNW